MATIKHYEFLGSWPGFWLLAITGIGIPIAFLYLMSHTLQIAEEVGDPEALLKSLRKRG